MMHTMERYFTQDGNPEFTDALAEALLRTVMKCAEIPRADPENVMDIRRILRFRALRRWRTFTAVLGCPSTCGN